MTGYKIAIVNSSSFGKWFPEHIKRLEKIGPVKHVSVPSDIDGKSLAQSLKGYQLIIASVTPCFNQEFFDNKDKLLLISRHGIGHNNIDKVAAKSHGTIVTIVPPLVERDAVAENAITNLLAIMRQTIPANEAANAGKWHMRAQFIGNNLTGKTAGVIGCGNIGSRVAEILKHGFRTRLLVYDPHIDREWAKKNGAEVVELDKLLREADVISLNSKLTEESEKILNEDAFSKMKKGVYITNTARGGLIDEEAMLDAIDKGIVKRFATDVMTIEPSSSNHKYFAQNEILVTPHTSAYTFECLKAMGDKCVSDVEKVAEGKTPEGIVTE